MLVIRDITVFGAVLRMAFPWWGMSNQLGKLKTLRILLTLFHTHACFRSQACLIKSTSLLSNSIYVFTINSFMTQNKRIMVEIKFSYSRLSLCIVSYNRHLFFSGSISTLVTSLNSWNRIHNFLSSNWWERECRKFNQGVKILTNSFNTFFKIV